MPKRPAATGARAFLGWRMVGLASLCVNVGAGFTFGAYGTFMSSMSAEFCASRSLAAGGLSLMAASMGLLAPVSGYALRRWSVRATLVVGFCLISGGWALMALSANAWQFIFAFGVLCGAGAACLITVPPMTLINNWFIAQRGRAAGVVMMAIMIVIVPPVAAAAITVYGWRAAALAISLITILLAPLTLLVIDSPECIGQKPCGSARQNEGVAIAAASTGKLDALTREPAFWLVIICVGLYGGTSVTFVAHFIAFAIGIGLSLESSAFLLALSSAAGLAGGFLGGIVADRIGGARTLAALSFMQSLAWACLLLTRRYELLALCAALIGICASANQPVVVALLGSMFGRQCFARAMGLMSLLTMPFTFSLPLAAGGLYEVFGSYRLVILGCAVQLAIVGTAFGFAHAMQVKRQLASRRSTALARGI